MLCGYSAGRSRMCGVCADLLGLVVYLPIGWVHLIMDFSLARTSYVSGRDGFYMQLELSRAQNPQYVAWH